MFDLVVLIGAVCVLRERKGLVLGCTWETRMQQVDTGQGRFVMSSVSYRERDLLFLSGVDHMLQLDKESTAKTIALSLAH